MKLLVIGSRERTEKYLPDLPVVGQIELVVIDRGTPDSDILSRASDADFIMSDAISPVSAALIKGMPKLKLIHSEGVAYNLIDVQAARERGIYVCNNAGVNAGGVAEQAILLMLMCLRDSLRGDSAVRAGKQIETKESMMVEGIRELGDCTVGFVGFGAIAKATALRLSAWGCKMLYNKRNPLEPVDEEAFGVSFAQLDELVRSCDIISVHVPVTDSTRGMVDRDFLSRMKEDAILINTARGEVVDNEALAWALETGQIGAAGLDTVAPEPVQLDNPLLNMSEDASRKVVFSPHTGGITEGMFYRAHRWVWENVARVIDGEEPLRQVGA